MLRRLQRALVFPRWLLGPAGELPEGVERWWLPSPDGPVEAWYVPAATGAEAGAPAVIHAHGNGERIDMWVAPLRPYRELGVGLLLVEYRGYGRSAGSPSEAAIAADLHTAYERLVGRQDVDPRRVVLHGRSLGGGAVCRLAAEVPVAGMILESTFTSIPDLVPWLPRRLVGDVFDNASVVAGFDAPLLLLHGRQDEVVPYAHAQRLLTLAGDAELVSFDCGHNVLGQGPRYWASVRRLLRRAEVL